MRGVVGEKKYVNISCSIIHIIYCLVTCSVYITAGALSEDEGNQYHLLVVTFKPVS